MELIGYGICITIVAVDGLFVVWQIAASRGAFGPRR